MCIFEISCELCWPLISAEINFKQQIISSLGYITKQNWPIYLPLFKISLQTSTWERYMIKAPWGLRIANLTYKVISSVLQLLIYPTAFSQPLFLCCQGRGVNGDATDIVKLFWSRIIINSDFYLMLWQLENIVEFKWIIPLTMKLEQTTKLLRGNIVAIKKQNLSLTCKIYWFLKQIINWLLQIRWFIHSLIRGFSMAPSVGRSS